MKRILLLIVSIVLVINLPIYGNSENDTITIALCRPALSQIQNIEILYEKDIIALQNFKLIAVYHEDEATGYSASRKYVKKTNLDWINFIKIKGKVPLQELFGKNAWSSQFEKIFQSTKGIIFTGGMDLPPPLYSNKINLLTEATTPVRSLYEVSFLFHLIGGNQNPTYTPLLQRNNKYVILGICLGCQSMNVAAGGTLYQDIPTEIYNITSYEDVLQQDPEQIHSSRYKKNIDPWETNYSHTFHRIKLKPGSLFIQQMNFKKNTRPFILSSHHQAIKKLGKDLIVAATSLDEQIIEAIQHFQYKNVLGVQFHPEYYPLYMKGSPPIKEPEDINNLGIRNILKTHAPSREFHIGLWKWFSEALGH